MSNGTARYMFAGHAIGAAARFHRLDEAENLNHVIPTIGSCVVPITGGRTECNAGVYRYDVDEPRRRCLFAIEGVTAWVEGRGRDDRQETELSVEVAGIEIVEKLRIGAVGLHLLAHRSPGADAVVSSKGSRIDGMRLGSVTAAITLDDEPLTKTGTADQFVAWHNQVGRPVEQHGEYHRGTIVREIHLSGPEKELAEMKVEGHTIRWHGFGRIILGEIHVKGHERRVTMVRLAMGSDAGGDGTIGDTQTNGALPGG
jgi:hypothetical protein